jgi:hypothetical protein
MTNPEFDLDQILSGVLFDGCFSHVLLFALLSYLGEKHVANRVRTSMSRSWRALLPNGAGAVESLLLQISNVFPFDTKAPNCCNCAVVSCVL